MNSWGTVADWFVVLGTLVLAAVAIFQETIRGWFYHPSFHVSIKTEPPDCVAVPLYSPDGKLVVNSIYLRLWVENVGKATARNVEVFANSLRLKRADDTWERVSAFPPMNLKWSNGGNVYFPRISPGMGKHCDVGHIADPDLRQLINEYSPRLNLDDKQTSLALELIFPPNHRGHIIGPGEYQLDILVAAENAHPIKRTILISLRGTWYPDESKMLRDGVGASMVAT